MNLLNCPKRTFTIYIFACRVIYKRADIAVLGAAARVRDIIPVLGCGLSCDAGYLAGPGRRRRQGPQTPELDQGSRLDLWLLVLVKFYLKKIKGLRKIPGM